MGTRTLTLNVAETRDDEVPLEGYGVIQRRTLRLGAFRGDGARRELTLSEEELIEVEDPGGLTRWCRVGDLPQVDGRAVLDASALEGVREGVGDVIVSLLKLPKIEGLVADGLIAAVRALEGRFYDDAGLWRLPRGDDAIRLPETWREPDAKALSGARCVLLLHGTFVKPSSSFGGLAGTGAWRALAKGYPDRVLAFTAPTMGESPVASATALLKALPDRVELDLLSYSRGGLIGELIAAPPEPLSEGDVQRLAARQGGEAGWREAVEALNEELKALKGVAAKKAYTVKRHARVATPLGGTPLAGRRLDVYLSIILTALGWIPALKASPGYGFAKRLILEVIARRRSFADLPGLAAMDPDAPLLRALALRGPSGVPTQSVAGDIEGSGVVSRLAVAATDLFFREDHDLVVPTRSAFVDRPAPLPQDLSLRGREVNHFAYFQDDRVRDAVSAFLRGEPTDATRGLGLAVGAEAIGFAAPWRDPPPRPDADRVFVLPGILGSELHAPHGDGLRRVWPDLAAIHRGELARLRELPGGVEAVAPLRSFYQELVLRLGERFDVRAFPYDWRLPIHDTAVRLAREVRDALNAGRRVHLVCHSMGGVVALEMFRADPSLLDQKGQIGRVVLLGTPTWGAAKPLLVLGGADRLVDYLAAVDFRHKRHEIIDIVRGFDGMFQMTARRATAAANWRDLLEKLGMQGDAQVLQRGERFWKDREALVAARLPEILYVAGIDDDTPDGAVIDASGEVRPTYERRGRGDGTVTWDDGYAKEFMTRCYWVDASHANIPRDIDPAAVIDLLEKGATRRLMDREPEARAGSLVLRDVRAPERARPLDLRRIPTEEELAGGGGARARARSGDPSCTLRGAVVHGSLYHEHETVMLAVFEGDAPTTQALALDRALDGALRRAFDLRTWPRSFGAWSVVTARDPRELESDPPRRVVLVNVGRQWELTRRRLREALTAAMRAWVMEATFDRGDDPSVTLSAGLLGVDGRERIGVEEATASWVEAAVLANRALRARGLAGRLSALRFVEPYRDIAARAAHALRGMDAWSALGLEPGEFLAEGAVLFSEGYFGDIAPSLGAWESWERVSIEGRERDGELALRVRFGDGAARFRSAVKIPRRVLEEIRHVRDARRIDLGEAGALLRAVSTRVQRQQLMRGAGLVLELGQSAAAIPWEALLADAFHDAPEVRDGVLRVRLAERRVSDILPATGASAFVLGDPGTSDDAVRLPAAAREAEEVRGVFALPGPVAWEVTGRHEMPVTEVMKALTARGYRVLHIASHGRLGPDGRSEVYLGDGCWRGPELIEQLDALPQLVFLNCCHLGSMPSDPARFAGNLAEGFLRQGVRAMVVAGWAISDAAARTFAKIFYDLLFQGETFGRAVRLARQATREAHPGVNSWAAFQCYGEPSFVLAPEARIERRLHAPRAETCVDVQEAIDLLVALGGDARVLPPERRGDLRDALVRNLDAWGPQILGDGEVQHRAAMLWLDLGELDEARAIYERLIPGMRAPSEAIENRGRALRTFPARGSEWAAQTLSRIAWRSGSRDAAARAIALMDTLRALWPDDAVLQNICGHVRLRAATVPRDRSAPEELVAVQALFDQAAAAREGRSAEATDRHALDAAWLRVAREGEASAEDLERLSRVRLGRRDAGDTFSHRPRGEIHLLWYVLRGPDGGQAYLDKGLRLLSALLTRSAARMWRDIVREFFESLGAVAASSAVDSPVHGRLIEVCERAVAVLRDEPA